MKKFLNWLNGKKTIIGIIAAASYSTLTYLAIVPTNELVWTLIAAWTGVSFRLAFPPKPTTATAQTSDTPTAVKYTPPAPAQPPETLAG